MIRKEDRETPDYVEVHKDDPGEWEAEPSDIRVAKEPRVVFSLRIRASDLDRLQKVAEREGTTISELIRQAVTQYIQQTGRQPITVYSSGGPFLPHIFRGWTTAPIPRREVPEHDAVTA